MKVKPKKNKDIPIDDAVQSIMQTSCSELLNENSIKKAIISKIRNTKNAIPPQKDNVLYEKIKEKRNMTTLIIKLPNSHNAGGHVVIRIEYGIILKAALISRILEINNKKRPAIAIVEHFFTSDFFSDFIRSIINNVAISIPNTKRIIMGTTGCTILVPDESTQCISYFSVNSDGARK